jgi:hypothetical protein
MELNTTQDTVNLVWSVPAGHIVYKTVIIKQIPSASTAAHVLTVCTFTHIVHQWRIPNVKIARLERTDATRLQMLRAWTVRWIPTSQIVEKRVVYSAWVVHTQV